MPQSLNPEERAMLRRLEENMEREEPALAERLRTGRRRWLTACSPANWAATAYLLIGACFLLLGVALDVPSAVLGGLAALGLAAWKSSSAREAVRQVASKSRKS